MYRNRKLKKRRGSAILAVVIVTMVLSIVLGSFFKATSTQATIDMRQSLSRQAQSAVETLVNFGSAEVVHQFENEPLEAFENYTNTHLDVPSDIKDLFEGTDVDPDSLTLTVGLAEDETSEMERLYVDPNNPANRDDPQKGKFVFIRRINVIAKASATKRGVTITETANFTLQMRDAPFFANAIFYNMDLELTPETKMEIHGPVYSNGDIYVSATDGLEFHDSVMSAGELLHGIKVLNGEKHSSSLGDVSFINDEGDLVSMKREESSSGTETGDWLDSHDANGDWSEASQNTWGKYVADADHNVPKINPAGFESYVSDDPGTDGIDEGLNHGYAMIEPVLKSDHADYKGDAVRQQKMAYNAGLILKVEKGSGSGPGKRKNIPKRWDNGNNQSGYVETNYEVKAYRYKRDATGNIVMKDGDPVTERVNLPKGMIGDADYKMSKIENDAEPESFSNHVFKTTEFYDAPVYQKLTKTVTYNVADVIKNHEKWYENKVKNLTKNSDNIVDVEDKIASFAAQRDKKIANTKKKDKDGDGKYETIKHYFPKNDVGDKIPVLDDDGNPVTTQKKKTTFKKFIEEGFLDNRQGRYMDALYLDVDTLRKYINKQDTDYNASAWESDAKGAEDLKKFDPDNDWNGVVYVEMPTSTNASNRDDKIVIANDNQLGLVLINGNDIPDRQGGKRGFSLATNGPMYLVGDFNADGDLGTGDARKYETGEAPAFLAADSFTVLSDEFADKQEIPKNDSEAMKTFNPTSRRQSPDDAKKSYARAKTDVEISAAILAGIAPTIPKEYTNNKIAEQSGGAHNFLRFLQNWKTNNVEVTYRGSMVSLFESEVHNATIPNEYDKIYTPPKRNWGFHDLFKQGVYPPGTPKGRTYRRESLRFPSYEEYAELVSQFVDSDSES